MQKRNKKELTKLAEDYEARLSQNIQPIDCSCPPLMLETKHNNAFDTIDSDTIPTKRSVLPPKKLLPLNAPSSFIVMSSDTVRESKTPVCRYNLRPYSKFKLALAKAEGERKSTSRYDTRNEKLQKQGVTIIGPESFIPYTYIPSSRGNRSQTSSPLKSRKRKLVMPIRKKQAESPIKTKAVKFTNISQAMFFHKEINNTNNSRNLFHRKVTLDPSVVPPVNGYFERYTSKANLDKMKSLERIHAKKDLISPKENSNNKKDKSLMIQHALLFDEYQKINNAHYPARGYAEKLKAKAILERSKHRSKGKLTKLYNLLSNCHY